MILTNDKGDKTITLKWCGKYSIFVNKDYCENICAECG